MRPTALIRIKDALRDILNRIDLVASGAPPQVGRSGNDVTVEGARCGNQD